MKKYISMPTVVSTVNNIVRSHGSVLDEIDFVVGMSRGGLIPAAMIATNINKPLVAIYIDKQDNIYLDRTDWLKGKNVLFIDDICRSGLTMNLAVDAIKKKKPKSVKTLTLFNVTSIKNKKSSPDLTKDMDTDVTLPWDYDRM